MEAASLGLKILKHTRLSRGCCLIAPLRPALSLPPWRHPGKLGFGWPWA